VKTLFVEIQSILSCSFC